MSEEKSLVDIAIEASLKTRSDLGRGFYWSAIVSAVEKEVIARLNKSEAEPVAGQELTHHQVLDWIKKHGSTKGLQWLYSCGNWLDEDVSVLYTRLEYRVAPKKVNDPDDPTTWEKGVAIFRRDFEDDTWILDVFGGYSKGSNGSNYLYYHSDRGAYKYAKLATPEQIEAWNKTQED